MRHRRAKRPALGASSNIDVSLQDTLGNGLAAVIVLTLIAASFSGGGKDLNGKRDAASASGIVLTAARATEAVPSNNEIEKVMDVWALATVFTPQDSQAKFAFEVTSPDKAILHEQYGQTGREVTALSRASMAEGGRFSISSVNAGTLPLEVNGNLRLFIGNRESPPIVFKAELTGQSSKRIATVCMPKYGDVRIQEHLSSSSVECK